MTIKYITMNNRTYTVFFNNGTSRNEREVSAMMRTANKQDRLVSNPVTLAKAAAIAIDIMHTEALEMDKAMTAEIENMLPDFKHMTESEKSEVIDAAQDEALKENKRFDWLASRYAMFWGGCDNAQRDEIIAIAWEQARHIIEAEEESKSQKQWKLNAIWKHTHRDYKGESDGVRSILICRNGTTSVPLENLTDAEIEQRSYCWK